MRREKQNKINHCQICSKEDYALARRAKQSVYVRVFRMVSEFRSRLIVVVLLSVLSSAFGIASGITLKLVVDYAIPQGAIKRLWFLQFLFIVLVLLNSLTGIVKGRIAESLSQKAQNELRYRIFGKLLSTDYLAFQKIRQSEITAIANYSVDALDGVFRTGITEAANNILTIIVTAGIMLWFDWRLTLLSVPVYPLLIILSSRIGKRTKATNREMQDRRNLVMQDLEEGVDCYISIRNYDLTEWMMKRFQNHISKFAEAAINQDTLFDVMRRSSWTMVMVPYQAILYGVGGTLSILSGHPTIGTILIFANLTNYLIEPVMSLVNMSAESAIAKESFRKIDSILMMPDRMPISHEQTRDDRMAVEAESLSYRYPDQSTDVFHNLSFCIPLNRTTILWGKSGSGKSTLLKILAEYLDLHKNTMIQKANGLRWSYFPQQPALFHLTVAENYRLVRENITEEEIIRSLSRVGLNHAFRGKNAGIDSIVGNKEARLSGGEYKRLCFAVFLEAEADVLLIDEPTTSLDQESANMIRHVLEELARDGKTLVIATHDESLRSLSDNEISFP